MLPSIFTDQIMRGAAAAHQRTGQYLFNHLPEEVQLKVAGTLIDPFYRDLSAIEVYAWLDNHLVFDGNRIIGLINGDMFLWESSEKQHN